uniref:P53 and DNA damage-regulated protein 1 n=1 Tax=Heterorhabditis bacteriophora TaxID=37862 RepID=A0A1I7XV11_HETBA
MFPYDVEYKESSSVIERLAELQSIATRISDQRKAIVALDERRQKLREAERSLQKAKKQGPNTWVCMGATTFIEFPTSLAIDFLLTDRKIVDQTITEAKNDLKTSVDELLKMEGSKDLSARGFDLKAINISD